MSAPAPKSTPATTGRKVVITGYVLSPFTPAGKGALKNTRADDITAQTMRGLIAKTGVDANLIDDLKLGCAMPGGGQGIATVLKKPGAQPHSSSKK